MNENAIIKKKTQKQTKTEKKTFISGFLPVEASSCVKVVKKAPVSYQCYITQLHGEILHQQLN